MRWEVLTKEINGQEWVVGSKLDSEKLEPETPRHLSKPLKDYRDENGKPKYIFDGLQIVEKSWAWEESELEKKRKQIEQQEIRKQYNRDRETELLRMAIDKLALGEKLPAEYVEYRKAVDEAKQTAAAKVGELRESR
jgi:hypothetical protein